jgi:hypothetical protein
MILADLSSMGAAGMVLGKGFSGLSLSRSFAYLRILGVTGFRGPFRVTAFTIDLARYSSDTKRS